MTKKVTLPREVAEAIEMYLTEFDKRALLHTFCDPKTKGWTPRYSVFHNVNLDTLMSALVNGFEIEQSPEEKVREYYEANEQMEDWIGQDGHDARLTLDVIEQTLDLLGIKIEGINA